MTSVTNVLDTLEDLADSEDEVHLGDVTESLGRRGIGPLILLPALLVISPLGGIPLFPSLMALVIALLAGQVALQREHLWLPEGLRKRSVTDDKLKRSADKVRPVAKWLDRYLGQRFEALTGEAAQTVAACVIVVLCLCVPPSEVIPFAAVLPMAAIGVLGLALTLRDGVVMLVGLIGSVVALWGLWTLVM